MFFYLIAFPAQAIPLHHLWYQRCQHGCSIAKGHRLCLCCLLHHNWSEPLTLHLCCLPDHDGFHGWFLTASPLLCAQTLLILSECWWNEFVKHSCVSASYPPEMVFNCNSFVKTNETILAKMEQRTGPGIDWAVILSRENPGAPTVHREVELERP